MSQSSVTRISLIARIRQADSAAWSELVKLYEPLVRFWCRNRGIHEQDVADLVQEIFFAVSRSIDNYHPTGSSGSFRAWLWSLTRNKLIDSLRRVQRFPIVRGGSSARISAESIPEELDDSDVTEQLEFRALVHRALQKIEQEFEPRSWQAFWRVTIDNQSVEQVAGELDMKNASVRQHRSRILRRLRQYLGELE
jgi:RNA polymerase sigma-70 factor (ECF subfamily)